MGRPMRHRPLQRYANLLRRAAGADSPYQGEMGEAQREVGTIGLYNGAVTCAAGG